ncbi:MAG: cupin domain-containing protein [candidate division NC10 bacterium]|nr:cupin domain-containing protein [candidate division NC10 bacterium]
MKQTGMILTCVITVALGGFGIRSLHAQQKQEYVPKAETVKLVETSLHGEPGKKVQIRYSKLPPGYVGEKHYHSGPVFVYILNGNFAIDEAGKSRQIFQAGQVYQEPVGKTMQARNLSTGEPTEILIFQVYGEGEALMYKVE